MNYEMFYFYSMKNCKTNYATVCGLKIILMIHILGGAKKFVEQFYVRESSPHVKLKLSVPV